MSIDKMSIKPYLARVTREIASDRSGVINTQPEQTLGVMISAMSPQGLPCYELVRICKDLICKSPPTPQRKTAPVSAVLSFQVSLTQGARNMCKLP
jgi:hypothetical protein